MEILKKYLLLSTCLINYICFCNEPGLRKLFRVGGPGPYFAFGQNILPHRTLVGAFRVDQVDKKNECITAIDESLLYGVTDRFTAKFSIPWFRRKKDIFGKRINKGIGDLRAQIEYAVYKDATDEKISQVTVLSTLFFPTSRFQQGVDSELLLGRSCYSWFFGTTYSVITQQWYAYTGLAAFPPSRNNQLRFGANVLYQAGAGITVLHTDKSFLGLIVELSGIKILPDRLYNVRIADSGSNTIFFGPVLRFVLKRFLLQGGFQNVIYQKRDGNQLPTTFRMGFNIASGFKF